MNDSAGWAIARTSADFEEAACSGMHGDLCDCIFNGSTTQLFRECVDIPFICIGHRN